jgi:hypothetical protein
MGHFADIAWRADGAKTDPKPENKAAANEHLNIMGGCLYAGAEDDKSCTCEHARASPKIVVDWASEGYGCHGTYIVDGHNKTNLRACGAAGRRLLLALGMEEQGWVRTY